MACFLVPAAEAAVVSIAKASIRKSAVKTGDTAKAERSLSLVNKLTWLTNLLWGGAALLLFEHIWSGEVIPVFPFLSAAATLDTAQQMLIEMGTIGVGMAALVTAVWGIGVLAISRSARRSTALCDCPALLP